MFKLENYIKYYDSRFNAQLLESLVFFFLRSILSKVLACFFFKVIIKTVFQNTY